MTISSTFASTLKQRRKALDLTQQELARQVGCAAVTIQRIEQGSLRPSRQLAQRLADSLKLDADERELFVRLGRIGSQVDTLGSNPQANQPTGTFLRSPLPVPLTPLIGRERERLALREAFADGTARVITLTGPGGTGKTRLAIQVAADIAASFADGVVFIELAPISDPDLVLARIAQAFAVNDLGGQPLLVGLQRFLRDKHVLLVLDNFEQVLPAAAVIAELLTATPRIQLLITSRVVIGVYGEYVFPVSPLPLPILNELPRRGELLQSESVRLFVERARAASPHVRLSAADILAVGEICHYLDGLPLALELAAVRVRLMSPQALLQHFAQNLFSRLQLLTDGARTLPARQQTLRATLLALEVCAGLVAAREYQPPDAEHAGRRSAKLFGAVETLREMLGAPLLPLYHDHRQRGVAAARAHLDLVSFDEAWAAGRSLTLEQAVAYVLEVVPAEIKGAHSVA